MERSYKELCQIPDYHGRLEYLKLLDGNAESPRAVSADYFHSYEWKATRTAVINRDLGYDLGVFGVYIDGPMIVHHINPITTYDIINRTSKLTDLNNLITTSLDTHNAIHYKKLKEEYVERKPGDMKFW